MVHFRGRLHALSASKRTFFCWPLCTDDNDTMMRALLEGGKCGRPTKSFVFFRFFSFFFQQQCRAQNDEEEIESLGLETKGTHKDSLMNLLLPPFPIFIFSF